MTQPMIRKTVVQYDDGALSCIVTCKYNRAGKITEITQEYPDGTAESYTVSLKNNKISLNTKECCTRWEIPLRRSGPADDK